MCAPSVCCSHVVTDGLDSERQAGRTPLQCSGSAHMWALPDLRVFLELTVILGRWQMLGLSRFERSLTGPVYIRLLSPKNAQIGQKDMG